MDSRAVEEPRMQPIQERSNCLKGNLPPERNSEHSNQAVLDLDPKIPNRKEAPRNVGFNQLFAEGHSRSVLYHFLSNHDKPLFPS